METPRGPKKHLEDKRTRSLDRSQPHRKVSESRNCRCLSRYSCRKALRRTASDGARCSMSPPLSAEVQGSVPEVLSLEEMKEFLPTEQGPPEDTKKDKTQSFLKIFMNFFLMRTGLEEPIEKASRRPKGKEEATKPPEPATRKKGQDKKATRIKHSHRKRGGDEPKGVQGQEHVTPSLPVASYAKEVDVGLAQRGRPGSELPYSLPIEGGDAGPSDGSPQASGPLTDEELRKPDQDKLIWKTVELLKKAGDHLEEEVKSELPSIGPLPLLQGQALPPEVTSQNPMPASRKKSQENKASLKKSISFKRPGSEEPRRSGSSHAPGQESWLPRRPSFLALCVSGHRTSSISSSQGSEPAGVHEALSTDGEGPRPSELATQVGSQGPAEELDGASESREFMQKILTLLQSAEEQEEEQQPQVQEAEVAVESLAPACKKKSQEKSSFRRAFSHKKHSSKEPKRMGSAGASGSAGPEARTPKKHSFRPMCVGGRRASVSSCSDPEDLEFREPSATEGGPAGISEASSQARSYKSDEGAHESKELMIHKLVALLQEVDGELGKQIRRHPSFKRFFYEFSDRSLRKLVDTLYNQKARVSEGDESLTKRPSPCAFGLINKFTGSHGCAICSLMRSRGQYSGHSYAHFLSRKAELNITSRESLSPD